MTTLLVGFDSAWTRANPGALVGVLRLESGMVQELGPPKLASFSEADHVILTWQGELSPSATVILLDQPTIVRNASGQRPVENLVASPVSRRRGGMQPANTTRKGMFDEEAPVWPFLARFGGAADLLGPVAKAQVIETYPVLEIIALGWTLEDSRSTGRLPKYNPDRKDTFSITDWQYVCGRASRAFSERGLGGIVRWIDTAAEKAIPRKCDQDGLDACLCLLVALHLSEGKECILVGNLETGYIVVPYGAALHAELVARCNRTDRLPTEWVRKFRLAGTTPR